MGTPGGQPAPTPAYRCPPSAGSSFEERTELPSVSLGSPLSEPMVSCRATLYAARLEEPSRSIQGVLPAPSATPRHGPFGCPGCRQLSPAPDAARGSRQLQKNPAPSFFSQYMISVQRHRYMCAYVCLRESCVSAKRQSGLCWR